MSAKPSVRQWLVGVALAFLAALCLYAVISPWIRGPAGPINQIYGKRRSKGRSSVNGTAVFAQMFQQRGSRVSTWMQLSPRLRRSDVIVWTPNSFQLPSPGEIRYFENSWLNIDDYRFRTLIYVGRDFDAATQYWDAQCDEGAGVQFIEAHRNAALSRSEHAYARSLTAVEMQCDWFSLDCRQSFTQVVPSDGPWAAELDAERTQIWAAGIMKIPEVQTPARTYEVLLASQETPLIVRITDDYAWPNGQIIVLLNGSSVLNLPLVNYENRRIAGKLIDVCENPGRVTFLESDPGGIPIADRDPNSYSGLEALTVWPINVILLHLVVAGILFCTSVFPIFGRPRELMDDSVSDFGKHVRAMGELLAMSKDREAAMAKVRQYRNLRIDPLFADPSKTAEQTGNPFKKSQI